MTRLPSTAPERIRILLVEDDPLVRLVAAEMLAGADFAVVEAENAAEALGILARGTIPDLLVTDVRMPGSIDGIELAHIVATRWPQMGILICSAHAVPTEQELPSGAMFLAKPYGATTLLRKVTALVACAPVASLGWSR